MTPHAAMAYCVVVEKGRAGKIHVPRLGAHKGQFKWPISGAQRNAESGDFKCSCNSSGAIPGERNAPHSGPLSRPYVLHNDSEVPTRVQLPRSDVIQVEQDIGSASQ